MPGFRDLGDWIEPISLPEQRPVARSPDQDLDGVTGRYLSSERQSALRGSSRGLRTLLLRRWIIVCISLWPNAKRE
jgi:hypothetical protein